MFGGNFPMCSIETNKETNTVSGNVQICLGGEGVNQLIVNVELINLSPAEFSHLPARMQVVSSEIIRALATHAIAIS